MCIGSYLWANIRGRVRLLLRRLSLLKASRGMWTNSSLRNLSLMIFFTILLHLSDWISLHHIIILYQFYLRQRNTNPDYLLNNHVPAGIGRTIVPAAICVCFICFFALSGPTGTDQNMFALILITRVMLLSGSSGVKHHMLTHTVPHCLPVCFFPPLYVCLR